MERTTVAVDLAKSIFQIAVSRRPGKTAETRRLRRSQLPTFFAQYPSSTVVMEACGTSSFWGRKFESMGHEVVLLPPSQVHQNDGIACVLLYLGQLRFKDRGRSIKEAAVGYQHRRMVGRQHFRRRLLVGQLALLQHPFLYRNLIGLPDHKQQDRQPHTEQDRILQWHQQGQDERRSHDSLLYPTGVPHHFDVVGL